MYDAASRLHAFVPPRERSSQPRRIAVAEPEAKPKRGSRLKRTVMHVVTLEQLRVELGVGPEQDVSVRDMCETLSNMTELTARTTAKSTNHASTCATTFGSGNVLVYVLHDAPYGSPQYLALGTTSGCRAEGLEVDGTWTVRTAFGGASNPHTSSAIETMYPCGTKTLASFHKPCFVKAYPKNPKARLEARALELVKMLCDFTLTGAGRGAGAAHG